MNIIREYSLDQVRKNRRTSVSIIVAVLIASTFLCTLLVFAQSFWNQMVQQEIYTSGDWDAELMDVPADRLGMVRDNAGVKAMFVKGDNQTAFLPEGTALPCLLIQNCDSGYWDAMYEKNMLLRGRIPQAPGEVVVSKDFFLQNPAYGIGDALAVEIGSNVRTYMEENRQKDAASLTIVGELDVSVSSGYEGYLAYGFMEPEELSPDSEVVVYLQMERRGKVYMAVPQIAEAIGLPKDEYGDYPCRYHAALLAWHGVYAAGSFFQSDVPKLFFGLLLAAGASMAVFAYIIRGAFGISAKQKIHQLGILKSVGAGPKQIGRTVIYEACILSVIPILLSMILGYFFSIGVLSAYSSMASEVFGSRMEVSFSPAAALMAAVLSFVTVLLAAHGPAKQMSKILPIEAVRREQYSIAMCGRTSKKAKSHPILAKHFGFLGEIAANSVNAGKKLYHTCMVTLSLCMLLAFGFLAVFTASDISNAQAENRNHFDVNITLGTGERIDGELLAELKAVPGVQETSVYARANCAVWLSGSDQSAEFLQAGGFDAADGYIVERDGRYRVTCVLVGMEQDAYESVLREAGAEALPESSAIIVNSVAKNPGARDYEAMQETVPYLNLRQGQRVELTEKYSDDTQGDYEFAVDVAAVIPSMPEIGLAPSFYTLPVIVPMEEYYAIIGNFSDEMEVYNYRNYVNYAVPDGMDKEIQGEAERICSAYLGSSDFMASSKTERMRNRGRMTGATMFVVCSLVALFGVVGISSVLSAILNSLGQRRKEFAMLRSVGVDEKGIRRLLGMEGFLLSVRPILIGLPLLIIVCAAQCYMMGVPIVEFLCAFPVWALLMYIVLVLLVINGIYMLVSKKIRDDVIVEAIKDDTV
ncbi:FtsX-like permease family protein [Acetatifactor muris]|uniref:FtsX-like permease family protein n=1 Tax=Acetatifactor muris TaxID=879566 RepID=A0A2K4ZNS8_9FIRM|nr:ABC transporter permease [Acetatifactor muris]MCR2050553.1 FtsX-like permease family protein [Acetatifactor muris]SOY32131.1 FtsX-like permease family protein [Acetatifactor muris]